jgi:hypothetical protein
MKLNIVLPSLLLLFTLTGMAQDTDNETEVFNKYFSLTFGLNAIDNSNGNVLPFDNNQLNFSTPFFLTAEQKIHKNWSLALTLSTNQLKLGNPAVKEFYFSADMFANLFVDDLIFKNENIDLYVGLGSGIHTVQGNTAASFNFNGGFRYWVSDKVAINLQAIGKINNDGIAEVDNHYQFNLGVAYKFLNKKQSTNDTYVNSTENVIPIEPVVNQTDSTKVAIDIAEPISQETIKNTSLDIDKKAESTSPELNDNVKVASTDLGKTTYEKDLIKANAGKILNTKTLNTKEFHVIIYAFKNKTNLDNVIRSLSEKGIEVKVIKESNKNLNYISIAQFDTYEDAHNYMDTILDKEMFTGSWVYEID